jgi:type I restriction enzyme S subunit
MSDLPAGYKQTEVGVIPGDWEVFPLGELFSFSGGHTASRDQLSGDGFCYLHYGDIHKSNKTYINVKNEYQEIPKLNVPIKMVTQKSLLNDGDVVFVDASEDDEGASKHIVVQNQDGITYISGLHTIVSKSKNDYIYNGYKQHCFQTTEVKRQFKFYAVGTKVSGISKANIAKIQIPLPPTKAEQTAIATTLSDADALIQSLEKLIAKKRNIKQGAMQELLKPKEGWVVKKLGEIFSITAGGDLRKDEFSSVNDEKYCYPIYSNALTNAGLYGYCSSYDHHGDCITVTARGTVGFANSRNHKFSAIGRLLILKPIEKLNCVFIAEYINLKVEFANESTGVPQLTAPQISKYEVVIPDYTKQTRIATILSDMDAEISALETKLAKYKQIKQGMMQNLLTGKIRLV